MTSIYLLEFLEDSQNELLKNPQKSWRNPKDYSGGNPAETVWEIQEQKHGPAWTAAEDKKKLLPEKLAGILERTPVEIL